MFINKPSLWGSIVLATLSFGSCSRIGHNSPELLFYRADGNKPHVKIAPRKVYRYSVVPGGVYSSEELERARLVDPVVTAHYADFGNHVLVDKLDSDMFVYVSYRKANHVYWSAQKHKIPKGEKILTDGKHMARTRCGNRLSLTPQKPVAKVEPPELNQVEDMPLMASLPNPPLFLPSGVGTPNLVPGLTGAAPGAGPAPVSSIAPGPSGSEVPVGGPVPLVPPGAPIVGPVLPGAPTGTGGGGPPPPVCPAPATANNGAQPHAADPTNCTTTPPPVTPVPEPSGFGFLLLAAVGAIWTGRKYKNR